MPLNVDRQDEALWVAENGQKISIEVRVYMMSQGGSWHYVSGKNVSLVAASTKDCALLYLPEHGDPGPRPGQPQPRHVKRLIFRET